MAMMTIIAIVIHWTAGLAPGSGGGRCTSIYIYIYIERERDR